MSDHAQVIVDTEVSAEEALELANVVRAWLVEEQIIMPEQSDSDLSGAGHRPGIKYRAAIRIDTDSFLGLAENGVRITVGRQVFDAGGNGIELRCDACGVSFEPDDSWSDAVDAWFSGDDLVSFPCPSCSQQALLTEWRGPWPWGFGNLGIKFWNWPPLSDDFIYAITRKLGLARSWCGSTSEDRTTGPFGSGDQCTGGGEAPGLARRATSAVIVSFAMPQSTEAINLVKPADVRILSDGIAPIPYRGSDEHIG